MGNMGYIYKNNGFVVGLNGVTHIQKVWVTVGNMGNV